MRGACGKYGGEEKCIKVVGQEARKKTDWKPRRRWIITLKLVLKKQDGKSWTGLIWLRIGNSGGL